jgi:hypothetical protein
MRSNCISRRAGLGECGSIRLIKIAIFCFNIAAWAQNGQPYPQRKFESAGVSSGLPEVSHHVRATLDMKNPSDRDGVFRSPWSLANVSSQFWVWERLT